MYLIVLIKLWLTYFLIYLQQSNLYLSSTSAYRDVIFKACSCLCSCEIRYLKTKSLNSVHLQRTIKRWTKIPRDLELSDVDRITPADDGHICAIPGEMTGLYS